MSKKIIIGNWKMNKTSKEASDFIKNFIPMLKNIKSDVVISPSFTLLPLLHQRLKDSNISLAAQNIFYENEGAYTGEISAKMIKEYASYVIIGHSERRKYFNETDETINKKIKAALSEKLKVVFCIGESLKERESNMTISIIKKQLQKGFLGISDIKDIIIAYEPVWAIGTGKNATPMQAQEIHKYIRQWLNNAYGITQASKSRIIYGGSVTPDNAKEILKMPDIDGCLPGGASLDPRKFADIIKSC
jgi:triosephosphate isomerase